MAEVCTWRPKGLRWSQMSRNRWLLYIAIASLLVGSAACYFQYCNLEQTTTAANAAKATDYPQHVDIHITLVVNQSVGTMGDHYLERSM
jgi:hypothetical protein